MDVTIRVARAEDVPALTILRQQALEAAYRDRLDSARVADIVARAGGDLPAWIADDARTVLLVETEVTAVGYGVIDDSATTLEALYVSPDYQREGFGSRLLDDLEASVRAGTTIEATVPDHAVAFFEAQGYHRKGEAEWHDCAARHVCKEL